MSKLDCNSSAVSCQCKFAVLDMQACAAPEVKGGSVYDLIILVRVNQTTASNKYTQACNNYVQLQGSCSIKGISDSGYQISSEEKLLAALGVTLESMSAYQIVRLAP